MLAASSAAIDQSARYPYCPQQILGTQAFSEDTTLPTLYVVHPPLSFRGCIMKRFLYISLPCGILLEAP